MPQANRSPQGSFASQGLPLWMRDGPTYSTRQFKRNRSPTSKADVPGSADGPIAKRRQHSQRAEPQSSQRQHEQLPVINHFKVEMLTPSLETRNTDIIASSRAGTLEDYGDLEFDDAFAAIESSLLNTSPKTTNAGTAADFFSMGSSGEAINDILQTNAFKHNFQVPPSSVPRALGRESRSAEEFDPIPRHSSLRSSTFSGNIRHESLLDHDVDSQSVHENIKNMSKNTSLVGSQTANKPAASTVGRAPRSKEPEPSKSTWVSKSFRGMQLTNGKTFFHIKEMLQAKKDMFQNQPEATFELFARVMYSSRKNFHHRQYFQLQDLFKEAPPYLAGALSA